MTRVTNALSNKIGKTFFFTLFFILFSPSFTDKTHRPDAPYRRRFSCSVYHGFSINKRKKGYFSPEVHFWPTRKMKKLHFAKTVRKQIRNIITPSSTCQIHVKCRLNLCELNASRCNFFMTQTMPELYPRRESERLRRQRYNAAIWTAAVHFWYFANRLRHFSSSP